MLACFGMRHNTNRMAEVLRATVPVFVFLIDRQDRVYLQRRYKTGYLDGFYETPAGKMDEGEFPKVAACREVLEETGAIVKSEDLELFHSYMNLTQNKPWLGLMFRTRAWNGKPTIQEPEKCDDADFFDLSKLPKVTPQVKDGLARLLTGPSIEISSYDTIL